MTVTVAVSGSVTVTVMLTLILILFLILMLMPMPTPNPTPPATLPATSARGRFPASRLRLAALVACIACSMSARIAPAAGLAAPPLPAFIRGDADGTAKLDLSDPIFTLNFLFLGGPIPPCLDAADANDDDAVNVADPTYVLNYLFLGGPPPLAPYPECGHDEDFGENGCDVSPPPCRFEFHAIDAIRAAYDVIETIAGKGEITAEGNGWSVDFEDGPATAAELSAPHIALGDRDGNVYIADKDAHAVRKVATDGTITTFAGVNAPGDDGDAPGPARERSLFEPNGLWISGDDISGDDTIYILDTGNEKVRKVDAHGILTTLFAVPGLRTGRGLWVADDESLAYVASGGALLEWTPSGGLRALASGFAQLGNFVVDPDGRIVVTDRNAHRVYRVGLDGQRTAIAGNGAATGGGDGEPALETGLDQVRGIWPDPVFGGYFLATQAGSQVWYLDGSGDIHLFLDGSPDGAHSGDGERYDEPGKKVSQIRSITADRDGNLLITEHDGGFVRRIRFIGIAIP